MKNVILSLFALSALCISCGKDNDDDNTPDPAAQPFMSLTANSTWNYKLTNNAGTSPTTSNYTLTSTSRDTTINSRTYHVFSNSNGTAEYYFISGNDYYDFRDLSALGGSNKIEYLYLKDNINVGTSWVQNVSLTITGAPFPIPVVVTTSIDEKGITKVESGTTYTNVIKTKTTITSALITSGLTTDIENYYAPKVGMIESKYKVDLNFMGLVQHIDTKTELESATIR